MTSDQRTKRRLFFLLFSMNVGGVEKSLLGLLDTLSPDEYEIHVGLLQRRGGFMEMLPSSIIVHDCCRGCWDLLHKPPLSMIYEYLKRGHLLFVIKLFVAYLIYKITEDWSAYYDIILRKENEFPEEFDSAYAYAGPATIIDYYICRKVQAKEKYGWIHFDVARFGVNGKMTRKLYGEYKKIFVVSEAAKNNFDVMFPEFKDKTEVRYNVVSEKQILSLSEIGETFDDNYDGVRILTVGRLSEEKGQDVTIEVLKILVDRGLNVRWYYVGDGDLRMECERKAQEEGLSARVSFLGTKVNPYGYMRDCDIYVQPSRHEGYCITLAEARCFTAPIVATNFTGAEEQLTSYPNSIVVGMSVEEIAEGVMTFLT